MTPAVSLVLCTVRDDHGYLEHPEWTTLGRIVEDLAAQVDAPAFELIIVDGVHGRVGNASLYDPLWERQRASGDHGQILWYPGFAIHHIPPRPGSPWVRMRKVAISAYRNTGIAAARGQLIVNLDDCCRLPPNFVATMWRGWRDHGTALAMTWPESGDQRRPGKVTAPGQVYGFGSFPRELALQLNGYDEAFDGGQGLEDIDWSTRLFHSGLRQAFVQLPGFRIEAQTGHSPRAIDPVRPIVKCCNAAWQTQNVWRQLGIQRNLAAQWDHDQLQRLVGPCWLLCDGCCAHHGYAQVCAYLPRGFPTARDPEADVIFTDPPVLDLHALSKDYDR